MVKFAEDLAQRTSDQFQPYSIDYNGLKDTLHDLERCFAAGHDATATPITHAKAEEFAKALDFQINRAVAIYEEKLQENVHKLQSVRRKWEYLSPRTLPQLYAQLKEVAQGISECIRFVQVNAEAVRKILSKAEKNLLQPVTYVGDAQGDSKLGGRRRPLRLDAKTKRMISQDEFIKSRLRPHHQTTSRLESLRVYHGLDVVVEEIRQRFDALRSVEAVWFQQGLVDRDYVHSVHGRRNTLDLLVDLHSVVQATVRKTKWYYHWLSQAKVDYEKEPVGDANTWGLFLNNLNTFLYLANYYAVIPSANEYAEALGLSPALSGLLLSMAPLSAMLASIFYSIWSNTSFKQPLLFCTVLLILGNYFYATALHFSSPALLFLGRLFVGLGGNRAVNRRYIADFVSLEARTFHSALFVAVGSLGMCLGPGCQKLFNRMNFTIPYLSLHVTRLTAPGWVMCGLWALFAAQVAICFEEPIRRPADTTVVRKPRRGLLQPLLSNVVSGETGDPRIPLLANAQTPVPENPVSLYHGVIMPAHDDPRDLGALDKRDSELLSSLSVVADAETTPLNNQDINRTDISKRSGGPAVSLCVLHAADESPGVNNTIGTTVCLWVYFVLKLTQEAFQTAAPMFTAYAFGWTDETVGYLLALIGIVVLPVNMVVGYFGNVLEDRLINLVSLLLLGLGCLVTVDWGGGTPISSQQYILGALTLFVSAQCLEAVSMSLLSKVMPKRMSQGLWNSGFLSTEAGTFGRVIGASLITLAGFLSDFLKSSNSLMDLQSLVMLPCGILVGITLFIFVSHWKHLLPIADQIMPPKNEADEILESAFWENHPQLRPVFCPSGSFLKPAGTELSQKISSPQTASPIRPRNAVDSEVSRSPATPWT